MKKVLLVILFFFVSSVFSEDSFAVEIKNLIMDLENVMEANKEYGEERYLGLYSVHMLSCHSISEVMIEVLKDEILILLEIYDEVKCDNSKKIIKEQLKATLNRIINDVVLGTKDYFKRNFDSLRESFPTLIVPNDLKESNNEVIHLFDKIAVVLRGIDEWASE